MTDTHNHPGQNHPGRTLDFIVFGVPRSGTTALVHALNLEPTLFCGHEVLRDSQRVDHATLAVPDVFLDPQHPAVQPQKARRSMKVLVAKGGGSPASRVVHFGNKQPLYYRALDRVNRGLPRLRNLCIYRSPHEFLPSWDRRAGADEDTWDPGRIGLFGLYEWLLMLARLADAPYALRLVDYRALFFGDPTLILAVLDFLGVHTPDPDYAAEFATKVFRGDAPAAARDPSPYDPFLRAIDAAAIDAMIAAARLVDPAELSAALRDAVLTRADAVIDHIAAGIAANPAPEIVTYGKRWCRFTLSHWDTPEHWAYARLRGDLARLMEALVRLDPRVGMRDTRSFVASLRKPTGDRAAATRLAALQEALAPGAAAAEPRPAKPAKGEAAVRPTRAASPGEAFKRARDLLRQNRPQDALPDARAAAAAATNRPQYGRLLARILMQGGQFEEAATALEAALVTQPNEARLHLQHSQALLRARRRPEAIAAADRAAALAPEDAAIRAWRDRVAKPGPRRAEA